MCYSTEERFKQEVAEIAELSDDKLLDELQCEWRRATWESPEDFSNQPFHPLMKLGRLLDEVQKRKIDVVL